MGPRPDTFCLQWTEGEGKRISMSRQIDRPSDDKQILEMIRDKIASGQFQGSAHNVGRHSDDSKGAVPQKSAPLMICFGAAHEGSLEAFCAINLIACEQRRPGAHQGAWNRLFLATCEQQAKVAVELVAFLHPEENCLKRASDHLSKIKKSLQETKRLKVKKQRRWNAAALTAMDKLLKILACVSKSKWKRAKVDEKVFAGMAADLKRAVKVNQRAARGLRKLLGNFAIDQRTINSSIYRILERMTGLPHKLGKSLFSEQMKATQVKVDEANTKLAGQLREEFLHKIQANRLEAAQQIKQLGNTIQTSQDHTVGRFLRQVREGNLFGLPEGLLAECAATSNYLNGWQGPLARSGIWFNEPVVTCSDPALRGTWICTSERVVERYWVMSGMRGVPQGASVLDAGCSESTISIELASSGFSVTAVDQRPYPLRHPLLKSVMCDLCSLPFADGTFDVAIFLSTIEHLGIGHYGDVSMEGKDLLAMREAFRVLKPDGTLLLTTPYGIRNQNDVHRIYDAPGLSALLNGFTVVEKGFAIRKDKLT